MAFNARGAVLPHRASAVLAAASAYDDPEVYLIPDTSTLDYAPLKIPMLVTFVYTYTLSVASGATGAGFARVLPEVTVAGQVTRWPSPDTAVVAGEAIRVPMKLLQIDSPVPPVDSITSFYVLELPPGATAVRFPVAELGDADHPGTFASWITVGG